MVGHPTVKCRDIMEKIQKLFNKGEIKYKTTTMQKALVANIMISHSTSSIKLQDKGKEEGEQSKGNRSKEEKSEKKPHEKNEVFKD